jgi:hypothetical protein
VVLDIHGDAHNNSSRARDAIRDQSDREDRAKRVKRDSGANRFTLASFRRDRVCSSKHAERPIAQDRKEGISN